MRPLSRHRALNEADRAEWAAYARQLRLLPGRASLPETPAPPPLPPTARAEGAAEATPALRPRRPDAAVPLSVGTSPGGVDGASWKRLRSGRLAPQRRLDLHGQTVQRAHAALLAFLHEAHVDRLRCVEIITGRGTGETGGVLRRELPHWLNLPALRPMVLAAVHPHPQNPGAVRLLLRRPR